MNLNLKSSKIYVWEEESAQTYFAASSEASVLQHLSYGNKHFVKLWQVIIGSWPHLCNTGKASNWYWICFYITPIKRLITVYFVRVSNNRLMCSKLKQTC